MVDPKAPPLLNAYAAKTCPRRVHNDFDATMTASLAKAPEDLSARLAAGRDFDRAVRQQLTRELGDEFIDLTDDNLGKPAAITRTLQLLSEGAPVIAGGWLPDDTQGRRQGRPDLLVKTSDALEPRYVPVEIKGHKTLKDAVRGVVLITRTPSLQPAVGEASAGLSSRWNLDDLIQLAHYWRMLEAAGYAADQPVAGVIGTDCVDDGIKVVWHDLREERFLTYSRSQGAVKRSALMRHDHELVFRLQVVDVAIERTGSADDPAPLVQPVFHDGCPSCGWHDACVAMLDDGDAAYALPPGVLSVREWLALRHVGITSTQDVATLSIDDSRLDDYWPEVTHIKDARERLLSLIARSSLVDAGEKIRRNTTGPITVPSGAIEVDFDVEWTPDGRVYLWGLLISRPGQQPSFEPVISWEVLDDASEAALARQVVDRLLELRREAEETGGRQIVVHYTKPEITKLRDIVKRGTPGAPTQNEYEDVIADFVDLHPIVKANFVASHGFGLKVVAEHGAGFNWRDEDPGGLQSQQWWLDAVQGETPEVRDEARSRLLAYNEDDVLATLRVREWLRSLE